MATNNQIELANIIKECHENLRQSSKEYGASKAWEQHKENNIKLKTYAKAMKQLSEIWEEHSDNPASPAFSRVKWATNYCLGYYDGGIYLKKRARELRQLQNWFPSLTSADCRFLADTAQKSINVLDVGSCYNPFATESRFNVTALDLCPASANVLPADFLNVQIADINEAVLLQSGTVVKLKLEYFHCIIFSLLLEYLPSSAQRLDSCSKAFEALCTEGILIIITPDSSHAGKNSKLWKQWHHTLATIGFMRVCFEKLPCITCMVFRKPINPLLPTYFLSQQTEKLTKELTIPQDNT